MAKRCCRMVDWIHSTRMPRSSDRVCSMALKADPEVVVRVIRKLQNASVAREGLPKSEAGGRAGKNCPGSVGRWTSQPLWTNRRIARAGTLFGEGHSDSWVRQVYSYPYLTPYSSGSSDASYRKKVVLQNVAGRGTHDVSCSSSTARVG
jgi:hypothetical protein